MDIDDKALYEKLKEKVNSIKEAEKKLAILINQQGIYNSDIKKEIIKINDRIDELTHRMDYFEKRCDPNTTYRDFTPEEIYQMRQTTSLEKLARRLHCSISTIQRILQIREEKSHG